MLFVSLKTLLILPFFKPTKDEIGQFKQEIGYIHPQKPKNKSDLVKSGCPAVWQVLIHLLLRGLSGKSDGTDSLNLLWTDFIYSIWSNRTNAVDLPQLLWDEFILYTSKRKNQEMPLERFWALTLEAVYKEHNLNPTPDDEKLVCTFTSLKGYKIPDQTRFGAPKRLPKHMLDILSPTSPYVNYHLAATDRTSTLSPTQDVESAKKGYETIAQEGPSTVKKEKKMGRKKRGNASSTFNPRSKKRTKSTEPSQLDSETVLRTVSVQEKPPSGHTSSAEGDELENVSEKQTSTSAPKQQSGDRIEPVFFPQYVVALQKKYPNRSKTDIEAFVRMFKERQSRGQSMAIGNSFHGFTKSDEHVSISSDTSETADKVFEIDPKDQEVNNEILQESLSVPGTCKVNPDWSLDSESNSSAGENLSSKKTSPPDEDCPSVNGVTKEEFNLLNSKVDKILGILQQITFPYVEDREKHLESLISTRLQESVSDVEKTYSAFEANCLLKVNDCLQELEDEIKEKDKQLIIQNEVLVQTLKTMSDLSDVLQLGSLTSAIEDAVKCGVQVCGKTPEQADLEHVVPKPSAAASVTWVPWSQVIDSISHLDHVRESTMRYSKHLQQFIEQEAVRSGRNLNNDDNDGGSWVSGENRDVVNEILEEDDDKDPQPTLHQHQHLKTEDFISIRFSFVSGPDASGADLISVYHQHAASEADNYTALGFTGPTELPEDVQLHKERARLDVFFRKYAQPREKVWYLSVIRSVSNIKARSFSKEKKKDEFYSYDIRRTDNTTTTISEADFPLMNLADILALARHLDRFQDTNVRMGPPYIDASTFMKDYLCEFGRLDVELYSLYKDTPEPVTKPNNLKEVQDLPFGVVSTPELGFIYHTRNSTKKHYFKLSEKHFYPTNFLQKSIRKSIFMAGPTEVANGIKEIINWWISVCIWMKRAIGLGLETCSRSCLNGLPQNKTSSFPNGRPQVITCGRPRIIEPSNNTDDTTNGPPCRRRRTYSTLGVATTAYEITGANREPATNTNVCNESPRVIRRGRPPLPAQPSDVGVDITNVPPPSRRRTPLRPSVPSNTDDRSDSYESPRVIRRGRPTLTEDVPRHSTHSPIDAAQFTSISIPVTSSLDGRVTNLPAVSEIAALVPRDANETNNRDVLIEERGTGNIKRISELHPKYMALQYPLLFPYGEDGYGLHIPINTATTDRNNISLREYYCFRLHFRNEEGHNLHRGGRLFHTYIMDAYAAVTEHNLDWYKRNHNKIRSELYHGLYESYFNGERNADVIGRRSILPASFTGGPRHMVQQYQDGMEIYRWTGPPDMFITMTCNPRWIEIDQHVRESVPGQANMDRPDIFSRVFKIKLDELMNDIRKKNHFGRTKAVIYTIEFQKPGLTHCYFLVFLHPADKISMPAGIDRFITAELPSEISDPVAFNLVRFFVCNRDDVDSDTQRTNVLKLPLAVTVGRVIEDPTTEQKFRTTTAMSKFTGWMEANRRFPEGRQLRYVDFPTMFTWHAKEKEWLPRKNGMSIGRLYFVSPSSGEKYYFRMLLNVVRGPLTFEDICTVDSVVHPTYMSACKALSLLGNDIECVESIRDAAQWQSGNRLHKLFVSILMLCSVADLAKFFWDAYPYLSEDVVFASSGIASLLLPGGRTAHSRFRIPLDIDKDSCCAIDVGSDLAELINIAELIIWDEAPLQHRHGVEAVDRTFRDVCRYYLPDAENKIFEGKVVVLGGDFRQILPIITHGSRGDIVNASINMSQILWRACTVFVLTTNMRLQPKNQYVGDGSQIQQSALLQLHVASRTTQGRTISIQRDSARQRLSEGAIGHWSIADRYQTSEITIEFFVTQPVDAHVEDGIDENVEENIDDHLEENIDDHVEENIDDHVEEQEDVEVEQAQEQGPIEELVLKEILVLSMAPLIHMEDEIKLLIEFFKDYRETGFSKAIDEAKEIASEMGVDPVFQQRRLIQIKKRFDESSTSEVSFTDKDLKSSCHRLEKTLIFEKRSDIDAEELYMELKLFETLETNELSNPINVLKFLKELDYFPNACIAYRIMLTIPVTVASAERSFSKLKLLKSYLHSTMTQERLSGLAMISIENEMLKSMNYEELINQFAIKNARRASRIIVKGDDDGTWITIPDDLLVPIVDDPIEAITSMIYADIVNRLEDFSYLRERCILCPTNDAVDNINLHILNKMSGDMHEMLSSDKICTSTENLEEMQILYPTEFLNSLRFSGVPNHAVHLKIGAPIILLRNLNLQMGLCNGTRLIVTQIGRRVIEAVIITGTHVGDKLYVASSRVTSRAGLRFYIDNKGKCENNITKNVVYKEVFYNLPLQGSDRSKKMSSMYRFLSDLQPELIDNWKVHVMVSRKWRTFNPRSGKILSADLILTDERLLRRTSIRASHIPARAFQRYCFDFIAYGALQSRVYEHTYLSGVPSLHTTCASDMYLNIPLNDMPILNTIVTEPVRFKLKEDIVEETVQVTTIPDLYRKLQEGVVEGAGDPAWISNFLYESLLRIHVVFGIKIDKFNLPPKFKRRFTVTKYYDEKINMDNIGNNTDNVENIDNVITVASAVASSSVVRVEQEIVDTMNVDGTAGNIKSVGSETLMFEVMFGIVSVVNRVLQRSLMRKTMKREREGFRRKGREGEGRRNLPCSRDKRSRWIRMDCEGLGRDKTLPIFPPKSGGLGRKISRKRNQITFYRPYKPIEFVTALFFLHLPLPRNQICCCVLQFPSLLRCSSRSKQDSGANMEELVCDKYRAKVDKSEHDCGKSGTKVTEMEVYQDGPDNTEHHECDEDIIGGSNVEEDVSENPVADVNEIQDTDIRDPVVMMMLLTSPYLNACGAGYGNDAYGFERPGVLLHTLPSPATDFKGHGNDASGRRYSKPTQVQYHCQLLMHTLPSAARGLKGHGNDRKICG
ncbi:hypothetical protein LXL04_015599 [Taraxacum kok-saghyz]